MVVFEIQFYVRTEPKLCAIRSGLTLLCEYLFQLLYRVLYMLPHPVKFIRKIVTLVNVGLAFCSKLGILCLAIVPQQS